MLVSSLIDMAVMQYPNLSRELVRSYINEIQKMILCKSPVDCLRVINDDDGYYTFSVTPNQKEYVLDSTTTGDYNIYNVVSIKDKNMEEYFIKQGDGNNAAVITFKKEYTKDTMSVIAYRQPNVIATEYDGLDFPDIYILSHFYIALQGLIENIHYNNPDKL